MSSSQSKKKEKLDLSKLSARELLLIGESQSLGSQPGSSKAVTWESRSSDDDSDASDGRETNSESGSSDWEEVDDQHVEKELHKYDDLKENGESQSSQSALGQSQLSQIPENGLEIVIPSEGVFRKKGKRCK